MTPSPQGRRQTFPVAFLFMDGLISAKFIFTQKIRMVSSCGFLLKFRSILFKGLRVWAEPTIFLKFFKFFCNNLVYCCRVCLSFKLFHTLAHKETFYLCTSALIFAYSLWISLYYGFNNSQNSTVI